MRYQLRSPSPSISRSTQVLARIRLVRPLNFGKPYQGTKTYSAYTISSRAMTPAVCISVQTGDKITLPENNILSEVERAEKKTVARRDRFDFGAQVGKRNTELITSWENGFMQTDKKAVLVAYMVIVHTKSAHVVELQKICVVEAYRHQGLGKKLLTAQIESMKSHGAAKMQLWVEESNWPARHLYQQIGFEQVRVVDEYYALDRNGVQMALSLV